MPDWYNVSQSQVQFDPKCLEEDDVISDLKFTSRRSAVVCRNGCIATSQPLASEAGLDILKRGGNAMDAAITAAAVLAVTEPCSTGLGGDMFCLYYDAKQKQVFAVNGSGRAGVDVTLEKVLNDLKQQKEQEGTSESLEELYFRSVHAVTVPGAARGWEDSLKRHGSGNFSLGELVEPAAKLAEDGFPIAPVTAKSWSDGMYQLTRWLDKDATCVPLSIDDRGPQAGELFTNPEMARVLRDLGENGAAGFYGGTTGQNIIAAVQKHGGYLTQEDLIQHKSTFPKPIFSEYRGVKLWQVPPNSQGITGLIALKGLSILENNEKIRKINNAKEFGNCEAIHAMVEMTRLGFRDTRTYVADEESMRVTNDWLLDIERIEKLTNEFNSDRATIQGTPAPTSCTVSFQVVDKEGNAVSFVNSNFAGFGSGIVPLDCGFSLQNRGSGFSLDSDHTNALNPLRRPYHTIIPGMLTHSDNNELFATISNMGGYMQPQGHLQLVVGMVAAGLDPQQAIDMPRFCIGTGTHDGIVLLEDGFDENEVEKLRTMGHKMKSNISGYQRAAFGKAQIIKRDRKNGVLWAGSDGRGDGLAIGY